MEMTKADSLLGSSERSGSCPRSMVETAEEVVGGHEVGGLLNHAPAR
jgi:hypothetical protein